VKVAELLSHLAEQPVFKRFELCEAQYSLLVRICRMLVVTLDEVEDVAIGDAATSR
jgi:hypothetical protein